MLLNFFESLRQAGVPVTLREFLDLLQALRSRVAFASWDEFYHLSRTCLVKDEKWFDRFDIAFAAYFRGVQNLGAALAAAIPQEWLRQNLQRELSDEEKAAIEELGGLEQLLEEFQRRIEEQRERHAGGNRWIGTGGTSPFGHGGYHPAGIRVGGRGGARRAVKMWERREYRNLDGDVEIGTRNIKMALRRLRRFARTGAEEELDLSGTIRATARNAGLLDLKMVPERRNALKILLFLDVGGSMEPHVQVCEELFSAARSEFKYLEHFYFHNFIYESVWRDSRLRYSETVPIEEVLRTYGRDCKLVLVGDAAMSPYEIVQQGGSIEHWNEEAGEAWFQRLIAHFDKAIWFNPLPRSHWGSMQTVGMIHGMMKECMYPLTLTGLEEGVSYLAH